MKKDLTAEGVKISPLKVCCMVGVNMTFLVFVQVQLAVKFL